MSFEAYSDEEILKMFGLSHEDMPNLHFVDVIEDGSVIFWLTKPIAANPSWRGSKHLWEEIDDTPYHGVVMFHQELWWDFYEKKVKELNDKNTFDN